MALEYRVRWRREGRQQTTRIYQTGDAAHRKARGIVALEQVKADTSMSSLPDLADPPVLEARDVGPWAPADVQPAPPTDSERTNVRLHFPPHTEDAGGWGPF